MDLILYICYDTVTTDHKYTKNSPTVKIYSVH